MHYQDINEMLAKGMKIETMPSDYADAITCANAYLLEKKGRKPQWLDAFLDSNKCKLVETICRATSASQGISSLQGYSEGYFNEIIQNANDLHCGNTILIEASKKDGKCALSCQYDDRGFALSNIYAFLNREMSDKADDDSKTGTFGVGIKSFFKFVDSMRIQSNVLFDFTIDRKNPNYGISGRAEENTDWKGQKTTLSITYDPSVDSSFNTGKLTTLIEYLCGQKQADIMRCFLTGRDDEIVFDIRSLIFMLVHARPKKNLSRFVFRGAGHTVDILCKEEHPLKELTLKEHPLKENPENDGPWKAGALKLQMSVDGMSVYEKKYIVFYHEEIASAFPIGDFSSEYNRMYSTYYLKADTQEQMLPMGMLIDSRYANIHRNDVGDSEEKINTVYQKVRDYLRNLYGFMCSDVILQLPCAVEVSDVFHHIIARYLCVDTSAHLESPLADACFDNGRLPKISGEGIRPYVVQHKEKEAYDKASYQEGNIIRELRENYFDYVEEQNVYDLKGLLQNANCIAGVRKVYGMLSDQALDIPARNREAASGIVHYFESVKEFLVYAISHERRQDSFVTDAETDNWLLELQEKAGKYFDARIFMKLIGRYGLNDAIAPDGSIRQANLSFKDYLFNGTLAANKGILAQYQNQFYDEKYILLKEELLKKRYIDRGNEKNQYKIRCIRPTGRSVMGWDGTYHYYDMLAPKDAMSPLAQPQLLLERMATDLKFTGLWLSHSALQLFETSAKGMWRRDYEFKNYTIDEQQIIALSCIQNIQLTDFSDFISAIRHRAMLTEDLRNYIHITCKEESVTTRDIAKKVLPVMAEVPEDENISCLLDEFEPADIAIESITENSNNEMARENMEFIDKLTGYRIHLYRFLSNTRRKLLAYFGNGACCIKTEASKKFREAAQYNSGDKNIYIFYDNIPSNLQQAVNSVLEQIGVSTKSLSLLEGYIHNGTTANAMSYLSRRRSLAKVRKKLVLDWPEIASDELPRIYDLEVLYRLLTARGSYDIFCPICSDIPLEMFGQGEDTKKKHSRRVILLENNNPDTNAEVPYIITVACPYCCQRLHSTLLASGFDGKNLVLTTQISHGMHEKSRSKQVIELSPVNIEIMKKFKI